MPPRWKAALGVLVALGVVLRNDAHAVLLWGQDDWDQVKKKVSRPEGQAGVLPSFDQWVLEGMTLKQTTDRLKSLLTVHVRAADRACGLSPTQRARLVMAGEADILRIVHTFEQFREKYREVAADRNKLNEFSQSMGPLQLKLRGGIYDGSSLFQKVLRQTLSREQATSYEKEERERRKFRYQARIELALFRFESCVSLTADQRQRLIKLLADEMEPPKTSGRYDEFLVLSQAKKIDKAKFNAILDAGQSRAIQHLIEESDGIAQGLRAQGLMP